MWDNIQFFMMVAGYPVLCVFWWFQGYRNGLHRGVHRGVHAAVEFMIQDGLVNPDIDVQVQVRDGNDKS
jgi:hypothetical protein